MKNLSLLSVAFFLVAVSAEGQTDSTGRPVGFAGHGAVTGFARLGSNFYMAVYDSGVFPISGIPLSGQIPGSDNVIISFISAGNSLIAGVDALDSTDATHTGTDGGVWQYNGSWSKIGQSSINGLPSHSVLAVAWDTTYAFAGLPGSDLKSYSPSFGGVWRAVPGSNWDSCFAGPMTDSAFVTSLLWSGSKLYAGTLSGDMQFRDSRGFGNGGVFQSSDHGLTWTDNSYDLPNRDIMCIAGVDTIGYVSTLYEGVFRKLHGAKNWTRVTFSKPMNPVSCFAVSGEDLFAGTYYIDSLHAQHGVFYLKNGDSTWVQIYIPGLRDSTIISALAVFNDTLYVGTGSIFGMTSKCSGLLEVPLGVVIPVGVKSPVEQPLKFVLSQNYPNPFNPTTAISYRLPAVSFVILKVYDVLGREVASLVNERKMPGTYTVQFDGSRLASGVYFYRLHAGNFTQTQKMLLVK